MTQGSQQRCRHCGTEIGEDAISCPKCGRPIGRSVSLRDAPLSSRPGWANWRYAGFWQRWLAAEVIDGIAGMILGLAVAFALALTVAVIVEALQPYAWTAAARQAQEDEVKRGAIAAWISGYFLAFYAYLWVGTALGGTIGKRILNMRVVRMQDERAPGFELAAVRVLVSIASRLCLVLGYLWAVWDDNKQTWHDHAVGTIVVTR